jgi:hypothetical protein
MPISYTTTEPNSAAYRPRDIGPLIADSDLPGSTFNLGLLRFHNATSGEEVQLELAEIWPREEYDLIPFAFDWRGRQFCRLYTQGQDIVVRADVAYNELAPLREFEPTLLGMIESDGVLEYLELEEMQKAFDHLGIMGLPFDECIGMKVPPCLGGDESLSNMNVSPVVVNMYFMTQIYNQLKNLPEGTPIEGIFGAPEER